jgi:hypothetical protein
MLERSPTEAFRMDIVDELLTKFREQVERHSHLEKFGTRICDLILRAPSGRVGLVNYLEEVISRLWAEQAVHQEAVTELEALRS